MLRLRKMCIDDLRADTVVPAEYHRVPEELEVCLGARYLIIANVQHHQLHEVSLGLHLASSLEVVTGENKLGDFVLGKDKDLESSEVVGGDQSSEAGIMDTAALELEKLQVLEARRVGQLRYLLIALERGREIETFEVEEAWGQLGSRVQIEFGKLETVLFRLIKEAAGSETQVGQKLTGRLQDMQQSLVAITNYVV